MLIRALAIALILGSTLIGCGPQDDIQTYKVPKPVDVPLEELTGDYQILGGMFPDDDPAWFFKFPGKASDLAPYAADFEKMLATVRFPNGLKNQPTWDTPKGWEVGEGRGEIVLATVYPDPKNKQLEVSLSSSRGGAFGNVKRWAGQLGQEKFNPGYLAKYSKPVAADKVAGAFVSLRGPKAPPPPGGGPMMMGKPHP
jgi:hypothetical protein